MAINKPFFTIFFAFMFTALMPTTTSCLPFVFFHGMAGECSNEILQIFTANLRQYSGVNGICLEIGNGYVDSVLMPLQKQIEIACETVKSMSELSEGYNIVAESQGNMIARGLIEFCDEGPHVKNYISLAGPHAGVATVPLCNVTHTCILEAHLLKLGIYTPFVQKRLAPAGYVKIPTDIDGYMKGCTFLPKLNNEINGGTISTDKKRLTRLQNLVLIMFEQDRTLVPRETSWFGFFEDGSWSTIVPVKETRLYKEDWIGLRTLDEAGKVKFVKVTGDHGQISSSDLQKYVVSYLKT